jgi:RimJ/RimL family protein N-acetyltransferase
VTVTESPARKPPAHDAWPLFGIRIRTQRLELRVVDDVLIPELARVAREGVHDPGQMPFGNGWTDRTDEDWHTGFARYFWLQRGRWDAGSWALPFAVLADGAPIGVQQLAADDFPVLRTVGTGSWLSLAHQGQGLGTDMRAAVLHFAFRYLGAELAITGAFPANTGSIRVSEKLGYLHNGVRRDRARGRPVDSLLFRLPRDRWESSAPDYVEVEGFEGCERLFGLDARRQQERSL